MMVSSRPSVALAVMGLLVAFCCLWFLSSSTSSSSSSFSVQSRNAVGQRKNSSFESVVENMAAPKASQEVEEGEAKSPTAGFSGGKNTRIRLSIIESQEILKAHQSAQNGTRRKRPAPKPQPRDHRFIVHWKTGLTLNPIKNDKYRLKPENWGSSNSATQQRANGDRVRDTGCGCKPPLQEDLFDGFWWPSSSSGLFQDGTNSSKIGGHQYIFSRKVREEKTEQRRDASVSSGPSSTLELTDQSGLRKLMEEGSRTHAKRPAASNTTTTTSTSGGTRILFIGDSLARQAFEGFLRWAVDSDIFAPEEVHHTTSLQRGSGYYFPARRSAHCPKTNDSDEVHSTTTAPHPLFTNKVVRAQVPFRFDTPSERSTTNNQELSATPLQLMFHFDAYLSSAGSSRWIDSVTRFQPTHVLVTRGAWDILFGHPHTPALALTHFSSFLLHLRKVIGANTRLTYLGVPTMFTHQEGAEKAIPPQSCNIRFEQHVYQAALFCAMKRANQEGAKIEYLNPTIPHQAAGVEATTGRDGLHFGRDTLRVVVSVVVEVWRVKECATGGLCYGSGGQVERANAIPHDCPLSGFEFVQQTKDLVLNSNNGASADDGSLLGTINGDERGGNVTPPLSPLLAGGPTYAFPFLRIDDNASTFWERTRVCYNGDPPYPTATEWLLDVQRERQRIHKRTKEERHHQKPRSKAVVIEANKHLPSKFRQYCGALNTSTEPSSQDQQQVVEKILRAPRYLSAILDLTVLDPPPLPTVYSVMEVHTLFSHCAGAVNALQHIWGSAEFLFFSECEVNAKKQDKNKEEQRQLFEPNTGYCPPRNILWGELYVQGRFCVSLLRNAVAPDALHAATDVGRCDASATKHVETIQRRVNKGKHNGEEDTIGSMFAWAALPAVLSGSCPLDLVTTTPPSSVGQSLTATVATMPVFLPSNMTVSCEKQHKILSLLPSSGFIVRRPPS